MEKHAIKVSSGVFSPFETGLEFEFILLQPPEAEITSVGHQAPPPYFSVS